ncbi:glycoside hydrolase family 2 protein [Aneurinibacillus danicus]|uniref:Glycoside hydrolase n=2 Tax=Aneurinibacillus TaxID=55079 RepID=A0A511V3J9_9BACL|nr:glycoside hydrolase family 2 TIM barrel-domain containing protein [Aneurinibacillus danicus]GEN33495.1 glycoside hydrolase [Aneurinibacillus danicus]
MHQQWSLRGVWQCLPDKDNTFENSIENKIVYASNEQSWQEIAVPSHWQKAGFEHHQGVMWYRRTFHAPKKQDGVRYFLHFAGVDYFSEVWLNGVYLGAHEGDFDSFAFPVTAFLRFAAENELIVKVTSAIDKKPERKEIVKGGLYHWDCLPVRQEGLTDCPEVPSAANAQYPNPLINPGGIWQDVTLVAKPAVHLGRVRITPHLRDNYTKANVYFDVEVHNETGDERDIELRVRLVPHNFTVENTVSMTQTMPVFLRPGSTNQALRMTVHNPALWWSWDLGHPNLYRAVFEVWIDGEPVDTAEEVFGIREVKRDEKWGFYLNGERLFIKGNNYLSDQFLSLMTPGRYERDIQMMLDAYMNMTRLFAHAEKPEFYRLCDERGIMIFQDLPFQWGYRSDGEFINRAADVTRRYVEMLYNHPSVVLWCCHSESRFHDYNKLDNVLMETVKSMDATRPVHKDSVLIDRGDLPAFFATWEEFAKYVPNHLSVNWVGWYWGKIADAEHYNPMFVTEYGTQSLPAEESLKEFLAEEQLWPLDVEAWRTRGFQNNIYAKIMGEYPATLKELVERTQDYQVQFYKEHTEALRRKKYRNVNGVMQFHFVNTWPAIDWAIIDYYRRPKKAYYAVVHAFAPLQLSFAGHVEQLEDTLRVTMEAWVVNDYRRELEGHEIAYRLLAPDGTVVEERAVLAPLIEPDSSRCFDQAVLDLPLTDDVYRIEGELRDRGGNVVARNAKILFPRSNEADLETAAHVGAGL